MKRLFSLSLALVVATGGMHIAYAQDDAPASQRGERHGGRFGGSLTPEERAQYQAAKAKAEADPAVVAAAQDRSDLRQRQEDVVKKALGSDPAALKAYEQMGKHRGKRGKRGEGDEIDPAARAKVREARKAARQDPEMQELQKKMREANKSYEAAFRAALIAADPAIGSVLDKMDERRGEFGKGKRGGKRGGRGGNKGAPAAAAATEQAD